MASKPLSVHRLHPPEDPSVTRGAARLGILIPSANAVMEPTIYRMMPPGVSAHFARVPITDLNPLALKNMQGYIPERCRELGHANVEAYAFGCTAGSFVGGPGYDRKIIKLIEQTTQKPATTTSTAVLDALHKMNIRKISLATPYEDWINQKVSEYLEAAGIEVLKARGLGLRDSERIATQTPESISRLARSVDSPEAQAIFISCTDFQAVEVIETLESELGKPVITSNQATLWALLGLAGIKQVIKDFGQLLRI